jgi:2-iminobutanoate/2-iminopropanoate deaminase
MIETVSTEKAPSAIGPYSQAKIVGNFIFTSGQIAINPSTGEINGTDIKAQTTQVMENLKAILAEAGVGLENTIKTTCFLDNMNDFAEFNEVYGNYFTTKPARSCVEVSKLPKGVLCEVEVIAVK